MSGQEAEGGLNNLPQLAASVVIPSSGRPEVLERTLAGLCAQRVPGTAFEVIVIDDGASPPLAPRLKPFESRLWLRSLRLERHGPAAARNAGARAAASPLLVFLDDDCVPDPHWLGSYLSAASKAPAAALAGPILNALPNDFCAEAYHLIFGFLYSRHMESGTRTSAPFIISANFAVSTRLFHSLGGFDERFLVASEDRMFSEEWLRSGYVFRAVPEALVHHHRPLTMPVFFAQQFRYGCGSMILRKASRARGWSAKPLESRSFYAGLLLTAFRHPHLLRRIQLFLLLVLSQAAIASGRAAAWFRPAPPPRAGKTHRVE